MKNIQPLGPPSKWGPLFAGLEDPTHATKARDWMDSHPEAMELFERLSIHASRGGSRKFGVKLIAERVRWEFIVERGQDEFKINNNFVAYIARELVQRRPELSACIDFRTVEQVAA